MYNIVLCIKYMCQPVNVQFTTDSEEISFLGLSVFGQFLYEYGHNGELKDFELEIIQSII